MIELNRCLSFILILLFSRCVVAACGAEPHPLEVQGIGKSKITLSAWGCNANGWGVASYRNDGANFLLYVTRSHQVAREFISPIQAGLSQDKRALRVQRLVLGGLYFGDGSKKKVENNYCDVIDMSTGCVSKTLPGSSCDGRWVQGEWKLYGADDQGEDGLAVVTQSPKEILDGVSRLSDVRSKASAISDYLYKGVESYLACYRPGRKNVADLNDMAFYLAEGGDFYNSLKIYRALEGVDPSRVVLKINIADVLWQSGEKNKARGYYKEYMSQMVASGRKESIPARVGVRVAGGE
ncbi:type IV pilus biogenesis/stability protein PilW [Pseudomonas sp. NPDC086581]|uniref:tetratricopeptide repeat protein n=1 Tax=Pseudomonas sp. NPDC086581 TaxID=3364432 RepID=UPI00381AAB26